MIVNLGSGRYPLTRAVNLDLQNGWDAREGLPFYDGTVDAITISHFLMYLTWGEIDWLLADAHRATKPFALVRVTEDDTVFPENVWDGAVTLLTAASTVDALTRAGFTPAAEVGPKETRWRDDALVQNWHGDPPKVFHVEGVRW